MSYVVSERSGRFLGDAELKEYHDLLYEVDGEYGCNITAVLDTGNAIGFFPDRAEQAKMEGFVPCPKCNG